MTLDVARNALVRRRLNHRRGALPWLAFLRRRR